MPGFVAFLVLIAAMVATPFLLLGVLQVFPSWRSFLEPIVQWIQGFKPWQILAFPALIGVLIAALGPDSPEVLVGLAASLVLGLFVRSWRHEFLFLMSLGDDDFPGRHDKAIWAFLMIALAPLGLWLFRAHRLAHWPEPKPEPLYSRAAADLT